MIGDWRIIGKVVRQPLGAGLIDINANTSSNSHIA
jgi:hypothetical protein